MADKELDPDLKVLMDELEKVEGEQKPIDKPVEADKPVDKPVETTKLEEPVLEDLKPVAVQKVSDVIKFDEFEEKRAQIRNKLIDLVDTHCNSALRIIEDVESDRNKCNDVYSILFTKLQANDYRASDVAAIVATLQTKADITKTRADMMDSVAKLLAALKNNNAVNPDDGADSGMSQKEIDDLLKK